ncbi:MAG: CHASE4 domain-containing protein [Dehalococcoidales bacterium]|nr:CHASE4 domain-containing protein [Dehalococcoidales bacterium]
MSSPRNFYWIGFVKLEEQEAREDAERVVGALNSRITWLEGTTSDWAFWDDTYTFADDLNTDYTDKNVLSSTFTSLQIDAFILTNVNGELIFGKAYDINTKTYVAMPQGLAAYLANNNPLKSSSAIDSCASGIILLPEGPMLVSSCPVLTGVRIGPPRGMLTMTRYLDNEEIEYLTETTLLPIIIYPIDSSQMPADFTAARQRLTSENSVCVIPQDSKTVSGYALINDINGQPALIIRTDTARDIVSKGRDSMTFILLVLVVCAVITSIVAIIIQDRLTLSRIKKFNNDIQQISASGDVSSRIKVTGKDELSNFTENINKVLATIEEQNKKETILRQSLEAEMNKRADYTRELAHELKTPITPILSSSELLVEGIKGEPWLSLAKNIYRGALDMNDRLDDLLDLAKGDVGILRLSLEEIDPKPYNTAGRR